MMNENIQVLYQSNADFKRFADHWAAKHSVPVDEILTYEISRLYAEQLKEKENNTNEEIKYEIRQDNGI